MGTGTYSLDAKALNALSKTLSTAFNKQLETQDNTYKNLFMVMPVGTNTVELPYMDDLGDGLNLWARDISKNIENLQGGKFVETIVDYEKTVSIKRSDIEDDNIGLYMPIISSMAENVKSNDDKLIAALLVAGASGLCYDGKAFFANDHPTRSTTTYDNLLSGALSEATIKTAVTTMRKFKGRNGQVLNLVPDTLVVPPDLEQTAWELVQSSVKVSATVYNDQPNYAGSIIKNVIVDARLTDTDDWYAVKANGTMKPFIKLERTKPKFVSLDKMDTDSAFLQGTFHYGVEVRYTMTYGLWQYAVKFVN